MQCLWRAVHRIRYTAVRKAQPAGQSQTAADKWASSTPSFSSPTAKLSEFQGTCVYCCALLTQLGYSKRNSSVTEIQMELVYFSVPAIMNSAFENWQIVFKEGNLNVQEYTHECIQLCYWGLFLFSLKVENLVRLLSSLYLCQTRVNIFSTYITAWYIVLIEMGLIV